MVCKVYNLHSHRTKICLDLVRIICTAELNGYHIQHECRPIFSSWFLFISVLLITASCCNTMCFTLSVTKFTWFDLFCYSGKPLVKSVEFKGSCQYTKRCLYAVTQAAITMSKKYSSWHPSRYTQQDYVFNHKLSQQEFTISTTFSVRLPTGDPPPPRVSMRRSTNVDWMVGRWTNIQPTLGQWPVFAGSLNWVVRPYCSLPLLTVRLGVWHRGWGAVACCELLEMLKSV